MNNKVKDIRLHLIEGVDTGAIKLFLTYGCGLYLGNEWLSSPEDDTLFRLDDSLKELYKVSFNNGFIEFRYLRNNANSDMKETARKLYEKYRSNFRKVTNSRNIEIILS